MDLNCTGLCRGTLQSSGHKDVVAGLAQYFGPDDSQPGKRASLESSGDKQEKFIETAEGITFCLKTTLRAQVRLK